MFTDLQTALKVEGTSTWKPVAGEANEHGEVKYMFCAGTRILNVSRTDGQHFVPL
jgi:hypothetical protein